MFNVLEKNQNSMYFELMLTITTNSYMIGLSQMNKNSKKAVELAKQLYTQLEDAFDLTEIGLTNNQLERYFDLQAKIEKYLPENEKAM